MKYNGETIIKGSKSDGSIDVNIQDQVTTPIDFYFTQVMGPPTTVATPINIGDYEVEVASAAGCSPGDYFGVFENNRAYFGTILSIATNTITLDTPLDYDFSAGSTAACFSRELDVDGSSTVQTFQVEVGSGGTEAIDITRLILLIETTDTPSLAEFGDLPALTNDIVLRRVNHKTNNIFNLKTNGDISNVCYDLNLFNTGGFFGGAEGFVARITFAGQAKHGVAIRLMPGDKLQMLVQDDLSSLVKFRIMAQGHVVEDGVS